MKKNKFILMIILIIILILLIIIIILFFKNNIIIKFKENEISIINIVFLSNEIVAVIKNQSDVFFVNIFSGKIEKNYKYDLILIKEKINNFGLSFEDKTNIKISHKPYAVEIEGKLIELENKNAIFIDASVSPSRKYAVTLDVEFFKNKNDVQSTNFFIQKTYNLRLWKIK